MLQTMFIKDTNQQYSIREDGQVINHYKLSSKGNKFYKDNLLTTYEKNQVNIRVNNIKKVRTINSLLKEYFGFYYCKECNKKVYNIITRNSKCSECINNKRKIYQKNYKPIKTEVYNKKHREYCQKQRDNITPAYVAVVLKTSVNNLSIEIIESKQSQLQLHRLTH